MINKVAAPGPSSSASQSNRTFVVAALSSSGARTKLVIGVCQSTVHRYVAPGPVLPATSVPDTVRLKVLKKPGRTGSRRLGGP